MSFVNGFKKTAKLSQETLEHAGLGLLAIPAAYSTVKAVKEKKPGEAALGATELGGLGILAKAVKAHPARA